MQDNDNDLAVEASFAKNVDISVYSFNFTGIAYPADIPDRMPFTRIRVAKLHPNKWLKDVGVSTSPSLIPSPEELDGSGGETTVLWVGLRPVGATRWSQKGQKAAAATSSGPKRTKGLPIATIKSTPVLPEDPKALRVVVQFGKMLTSYFVLVNQAQGLCDGLRVTDEEVFFFKEFRDDTIGQTEERKRDFRRRVKEATGGDETPSAEEVVVEIPWKVSFANQVQGLASTHTASGARWPLEILKKVLEQGDPDLKRGTAVLRNHSTAKLLNIEESFNEKDADAVVTEVHVSYRVQQVTC